MNMAPPSLHWRGSRVKSLAAAVLLVLAAAASHPALMAQTPAPVIEKLKPTSGSVGTNVKIKGSNFGTSPGTVTFNGTNAPVNPNSNWESDKIQVKVPSGATTGPVVVTTSGGQSSAGVAFTVTISAPLIEKLKPALGPVGTNVKIKGSNFGTSPGTVTFNGTNAPVNPNSNWESDKIQVKVPEGATDRAGGGEDVRWTVERRRHFHRDPPCAGHLPAGPQFGTRELLGHHRGFQFRQPNRQRHLQRNHRIHHQLGQRRDSDKGAVGATTGPVVVRTSGGQSSAGVTFTVTLPAPVISRLDPNSGLVNSSVTIEGSNFGSQTGSVTFNGTTASTTSWASDEIQTRVPSGSHHRAGGGEDVRWTVERRRHFHRDPPCAGHLPVGSEFGTRELQRSPSRVPISAARPAASPSTEPPHPPPVGPATRFRQRCRQGPPPGRWW